MTARVFFYVQHLLGIGHLRRAAVLARALADGGFDVLLVSGGAPEKLDIGRARLHPRPSRAGVSCSWSSPRPRSPAVPPTRTAHRT